MTRAILAILLTACAGAAQAPPGPPDASDEPCPVPPPEDASPPVLDAAPALCFTAIEDCARVCGACVDGGAFVDPSGNPGALVCCEK